jgi:hypothetical protein
MYGYNNRKSMRTNHPIVNKRRKLVTEPPSSNKRALLKDIDTSPLNESGQNTYKSQHFMRSETPENSQEMHLKYHIVGIVRIVRKWYQEATMVSRIILALLALYILSNVVNMLIQIVNFSISSIYIILGILSSAIVIYEFLKKKHSRG